MSNHTTVATATTNTTPNSNVNVYIAGMTLAWEIQNNLYGDKLPIIPRESRVLHGKVLYRLRIKATLRGQGGPVSGRTITVRSDRAHDQVHVNGPTTSDGSAIVTLETREPGNLRLSVNDSDITAAPLAINLKDAWYESTFLITGYHVCAESDHIFSGDMVMASGLGDQHRKLFLFGPRGIIMNGTGQAINGQYVRPSVSPPPGHWLLDNHGHKTDWSNHNVG